MLMETPPSLLPHHREQPGHGAGLPHSPFVAES